MSAQLELVKGVTGEAGKRVDQGSALQRLMGASTQDNPFDFSPKELHDLRLKAAQEVFSLRRSQIQVLDRRAADTGVNEIRTMEDIVPLLFSHTTYKSYPISYIKKGQWDRLLKWFGTLSAVPVGNVNLEGVKDVDDFIDRLWEAGNICITTSGTSGKVSFLQLTREDHAFRDGWTEKHWFFPEKMRAYVPRHYFRMAPRYGPYLAIVAGGKLIEMMANPDSLHYLSEDRLRITYLMRAGEMRTRIGDGSATPQEISDYEAEVKAQQAKAMAQFEVISDKVLELRKEPMFLMAQWAMLWRIVEKARARGIGDGEFHPDSIVTGGGGLKGLKLPPDYVEQTRKFLGPKVYMTKKYGMSEMSATSPMCEHGNYHPVPWVIPMLLDATGENLLDHKNGVVEGRFSFLDLSFQGRWGGLITGDKVRMDFSGTCGCGRPGPVVLPGITRYSDLGEEDKIGCAGTIEAYIKGAIE
jgi:hypothetical protein